MSHFLCSFSDTNLMALAISLLEDLLSLIFFMKSHPLQLGYLIFFSGYLVRVISFLYPLLLTTLLFLVIFFTFFASPEGPLDDPSEALPELFGKTCKYLLGCLRQSFEGNSEVIGDGGVLGSIFFELEACLDFAVEESYKETKEEEKERVVEEVIPSNGMIAWEEFEAIGKLYKALTDEVGEHHLKLALQNLRKKNLLGAKEESLYEKQVPKEAPLAEWEHNSVDRKVSADKWILQRDGSVRREKEWSRTLACKLYEERWKAGGGVGGEEGMDLLWVEAAAGDPEEKKETMKCTRSGSRRESNGKKKKCSIDLDETKEVEDEGEEEDEVVGQVCCLQALKFSTPKMGFGMGKLMKVSKAFKGGVSLIRNPSRRGSKKV